MFKKRARRADATAGAAALGGAEAQWTEDAAAPVKRTKRPASSSSSSSSSLAAVDAADAVEVPDTAPSNAGSQREREGEGAKSTPAADAPASESAADAADEQREGYRGRAAYKTAVRPKTAEEQRAASKAGVTGPLAAPAHLRVTSRFDYQPDVCKDYKETGFCGYGDSCIFLHDRGTYKSGIELERDWAAAQEGKTSEEEVASKKRDEPFACHICRKPFRKPVLTLCKHKFCQACAFAHHAKSARCAVCGEPTKGIFNNAA